MKIRVALGTGLLLTLGTAVAGTLMYGQGPSGQAVDPYLQASVVDTRLQQSEVTPEMIAMWKATAASSDYIAPKVPL